MCQCRGACGEALMVKACGIPRRKPGMKPCYLKELGCIQGFKVYASDDGRGFGRRQRHWHHSKEDFDRGGMPTALRTHMTYSHINAARHVAENDGSLSR
jgi:hypothetical protein